MPCPSQVSLFKITAVASVLAAIFSSLSAFRSYKLARALRDELKSDEVLIFSRLVYPGLAVAAHDACVLTCRVFNKSKRKAYIHAIRAFDREGKQVNIAWSNRTDPLGNIETRTQLIGVVDSEDLYIRQADGEQIEYWKLEVSHSFSSRPELLVFDQFHQFDDQIQ